MAACHTRSLQEQDCLQEDRRTDLRRCYHPNDLKRDEKSPGTVTPNITSPGIVFSTLCLVPHRAPSELEDSECSTVSVQHRTDKQVQQQVAATQAVSKHP